MKNIKELQSTEDLDLLIERSKEKPQIIFKHSTSCSISAFVKNRVYKQLKSDSQDLDFNYLDLIQYRNISNLIADRFQVIHESPQIIVVSKGQSIYNASHLDISMDALPVVLEKIS
ncbi:bacillithiol system redox-active protein YtxJ [Membranihabitans marinus]|uniref:bacillithiol system redox-active protein YtxJ n=1 Tax=Membranihabitans marinus TaxID=1227546 RepID=UPI001F010CFE|nr:bacillithiol system redox-active protein YtxJ [Membranihabitans marinus]